MTDEQVVMQHMLAQDISAAISVFAMQYPVDVDTVHNALEDAKSDAPQVLRELVR